MITTVDKNIFKPLKKLPESFFKNKKYGEFYYNKYQNDKDLFSEHYEFIFKKDNFVDQPLTNRTYIEDVEKALDFLNNTELLELVDVKPILKDYIDIMLLGNGYVYEKCKNIKTNKYYPYRYMAGRYDSSRIEEVLSKEINNILISSIDFDELNINNALNRHMYNLEDIKRSVETEAYYMNNNYNINPTHILIPSEIFSEIYENKSYFKDDEAILTKTDKTIFDIPVWNNPHCNHIILYHKSNTSDNKLYFMPQLLFAKKEDEKETKKFIHRFILDFITRRNYDLKLKDDFQFSNNISVIHTNKQELERKQALNQKP